MKSRSLKTILIVTAVLVPGVCWAGHPSKRSGPFIGFNMGWGSADVSIPEAGDLSGEEGGIGNFRLGSAVTKDVLLGVESYAWSKTEVVVDTMNTNTSLSLIALAVTMYPGLGNLFIRGGVGLSMSTISMDLPDGWTRSKNETGFGVIGALGYEWRLTEKFALGPQAEIAYLDLGNGYVYTADIWDISLGFNWYW